MNAARSASYDAWLAEARRSWPDPDRVRRGRAVLGQVALAGIARQRADEWQRCLREIQIKATEATRFLDAFHNDANDVTKLSGQPVAAPVFPWEAFVRDAATFDPKKIETVAKPEAEPPRRGLSALFGGRS